MTEPKQLKGLPKKARFNNLASLTHDEIKAACSKYLPWIKELGYSQEEYYDLVLDHKRFLEEVEEHLAYTEHHLPGRKTIISETKKLLEDAKKGCLSSKTYKDYERITSLEKDAEKIEQGEFEHKLEVWLEQLKETHHEEYIARVQKLLTELKSGKSFEEFRDHYEVLVKDYHTAIVKEKKENKKAA